MRFVRQAIDSTRHIRDFGFEVSDLTHQIGELAFHVADFTLQVDDLEFQVADFTLQVVDFAVQVIDLEGDAGDSPPARHRVKRRSGMPPASAPQPPGSGNR